MVAQSVSLWIVLTFLLVFVTGQQIIEETDPSVKYFPTSPQVWTPEPPAGNCFRTYSSNCILYFEPSRISNGTCFQCSPGVHTDIPYRGLTIDFTGVAIEAFFIFAIGFKWGGNIPNLQVFLNQTEVSRTDAPLTGTQPCNGTGSPCLLYNQSVYNTGILNYGSYEVTFRLLGNATDIMIFDYYRIYQNASEMSAPIATQNTMTFAMSSTTAAATGTQSDQSLQPTAATGAGSSSAANSGNANNLAAIIGGTVGGVVGLALICLAVFLCICLNRRKSRKHLYPISTTTGMTKSYPMDELDAEGQSPEKTRALLDPRGDSIDEERRWTADSIQTTAYDRSTIRASTHPSSISEEHYDDAFDDGKSTHTQATARTRLSLSPLNRRLAHEEASRRANESQATIAQLQSQLIQLQQKGSHTSPTQ